MNKTLKLTAALFFIFCSLCLYCSKTACAQELTVLRTIDLGMQPKRAIINPDTNLVYVSPGEASYVVIDGFTNSLVENVDFEVDGLVIIIDIDIDPITNNFIALVDNYLHEDTEEEEKKEEEEEEEEEGEGEEEEEEGEGEEEKEEEKKINHAALFITDTTSNHVFSSFSLEITVNETQKLVFPEDVAVNQITNRVYMLDLKGGRVLVFDQKSLFSNPESSISVGSRPTTMAFDLASQLIYVFNSADYTINVIDGTTETITDTIKTDQDTALLEFAFNPLKNRIYMAFSNNTIRIMDRSTFRFTEKIDIPKTSQEGKLTSLEGIAVNPATNQIFAISSSTDELFVIDGETNNVVNTIKVGRWPIDVEVNPKTNLVYVANNISEDMSVIGRDDIILPTPLEPKPTGTGIATPTETEEPTTTPTPISNEPGVIFGFVTDSVFNQPIEGAEVLLIGDVRTFRKKITRLTNSDGSFKFANIKPGNYALSVCDIPFHKCTVIDIEYPGGSFAVNVVLDEIE